MDMTNVLTFQPLSAVALNPQAPHALQDVFRDKVVPPSYVEKKAWIMHGPRGAGTTTLAEALYNDRRFIAKHAHDAAVFISAEKIGPGAAAQAFGLALKEGYSVFLDIPADARTIAELKNSGYHTRLISLYAPWALCADGVQDQPLDDAAADRARSLGKFNDMGAAADTVSLRYAPTADTPVSEVLYMGSRRSAVYAQRRIVIGDRAVLARLLRDLRSEGADEALHAVPHTVRETLNRTGRAMAETVAGWAGPAGRLSLAPQQL